MVGQNVGSASGNPWLPTTPHHPPPILQLPELQSIVTIRSISIVTITITVKDIIILILMTITMVIHKLVCICIPNLKQTCKW